MTCKCEPHNLKAIIHPANAVDYQNRWRMQGYQVYQCRVCGAHHGCRFQWDSGTGSDNRWIKFDSLESVKRHY